MDKDLKLSNFTTSLESKSFYKAVKNYAPDRVEVEIGDSKDKTKIYPQAKIMRWDNETNLSVRYVDKEKSGAEGVTADNNKFTWSKGKVSVEIYEKPEIDEDGGLEIEVVFQEKPTSNIVEFSIETKGLDFFYQPELTQEEIDRGDIRPENVVGSYAVYHSEKAGNIVGGKEYKTGKAFHIYRPKVIDAGGNESWAELNVDVNKKILEVRIDQKFLDSATYPVRVDPTFGYTTAGGSSTAFGSQPTGGGSSFTGAAGTIDSISMYCNTSNAPGTDFAIYLHSDGSLIDSGGNPDSYSKNGAGWLTIPMHGVSLSAVDYILVGKNFNAGITAYYDAGATNQGHYAVTGYYSWDNPETFSHNNNKYSIYATYTASASGPTGVKTMSGLAIASVKTINGLAIASVKTVQG